MASVKEAMETVKRDCTRLDCKYRGHFDSQPCCVFMIVTGKPRGCSISECARYSPGKLKMASYAEGFRYDE